MEKKRISEYSEQIRGVSYKPEDIHDDLNDNSITLLRANNIADGNINFDNVVYVDKSKVSKKQLLKKGDVLICASSGSKHLVGKAAQIDFEGEYTFGAFCKVVRPININNIYMGMYFQSSEYRRTISSVSQGANINNIKNEDIDNLLIKVPNEAVQKNVSEVLIKVSQIIMYRKQQLEEFNNLIKSRFAEMFGDYFRTEINCKQLKDICDFIDYRGKTPEKSKSGIPLITAKNVKSNAFNIEPKEFIPIANYDEHMTRGFPQVNDVLFTTEAPLGNVCRIPNIYDKFCVGQRLITIQPHREILNSEYVEMALLSKEFQDKMWRRSSGSTVKGIRSKELVLLTIPVPPIDLQTHFADFIQQVDKLKVDVKKSLDETQVLFDSLIKKYFG